jgi:hypothetical protein
MINLVFKYKINVLLTILGSFGFGEFFNEYGVQIGQFLGAGAFSFFFE